MDKLNKKLIEAKNRLTKIDEEKKTLENEYKYLQDKIHFHFDSPKYDTSECEKYIISSFWGNAYKNYKDGGYITNDEYMSEVRFSYETKLLEKIITKKSNNRRNALDIGCGNGRYTKEFAKSFKNTLGIDLSQQRINQNKIENKNENIEYLYADFMTMNSSALGTFDFVFVGDIFMYTNKKMVEKVYKNLLELLKKDGVLIIRESTRIIGFEDYKSKNYVAYYRNSKFYTKGIFKNKFEKSYRNYSYNLYHLEKYFHLHENSKEEVRKNPMLLKKIVKNSVEISLKSSHFYLFRA